MTAAADTRALDLLASRSTQGLEPQEQAELEGFLSQRPELDDDSFDLAAAAVELVYLETSEPLPGDVRARLSTQANELFGRTPSRSERPYSSGSSGCS